MVNDLVAHQRALESQLKVASSTLPAEAHSMGVSLTNALKEGALARAVEASAKAAQEPNNHEARLQALNAVAEVKAIAAALVDTFNNVYP